jgi:hypothetical protein
MNQMGAADAVLAERGQEARERISRHLGAALSSLDARPANAARGHEQISVHPVQQRTNIVDVRQIVPRR